MDVQATAGRAGEKPFQSLDLQLWVMFVVVFLPILLKEFGRQRSLFDDPIDVYLIDFC